MVSHVPRLLVLGMASMQAVTGAAFVTTAKSSARKAPIRSLHRYHYRCSLNAGHDHILASYYDDDRSQHLKNLISNKDRRDDDISDAISALESSFHVSTNNTSTEDRTNTFNDLIGLYEVQYVLSSNKKNNPVGGKWTRSNGIAQKLFQTRKTFQHLLPFNETGLSRSIHSGNAVAEAINVLSLDALDGFLRVTVLLRGDAVPLSLEERVSMNANRTMTPLSDRAVRAYFDSPRVIFGKRRRRYDDGYSYLPLQLGPISNVVLDTTYYDDTMRIGMGGTSGTRFVFVRTSDGEAREYETLLSLPLANKRKIMSRLGLVMALSLCVAVSGDGMSNLGSKLLSRLSSTQSDVVNSVIQSVVGVFARATRRWLLIGLRVLAGISSFFTGLSMLLISFSSGGIEKDEMT
ncbi:hypothetical protein HJC23_000183 [Cyclotella cryptica]|uniref:Plastid lipid-associated protein/fibrillin conserved domain-containing protein n=1 Tax=Cyclotella cryptica TaxID=29204 RepID=A0ABD3QE87_9STRA|eukprot:CCRYP_006371-RA/>CCRYP_006371-RA protein AED:0.32 eAED:0.31 QI:0/-1/0/1/-1/1/1/0/404